MAPSGDNKARIKILFYSFYNPGRTEAPLLLSHANVLVMKRKAHYPVTHTQIKTFTVSSGAQQISIDNAFLGTITERVQIALIKNTAIVGSASTYPYHFQRNVTNLVFYVNGVQLPSEPHTVDCSSPFEDTRAHETLFSGTGIHHDDRAPMITLEIFTKGFYILGFDLTLDRGIRREYKPAT